MFRLPGIFRTVALYSTPKVQIRDLVATPDLDNNYTDGSLTIQADIRNFGKKTAKGYKVCYSLYANKLYSDENEPVILARDTKGAAIRNSVVAQVEPITTGNTQEAEKVVLKVKNPNKWSAETPYRYTLIAELKDHKTGVSRQYLRLSVSGKWKSKTLRLIRMSSAWPAVITISTARR